MNRVQDLRGLRQRFTTVQYRAGAAIIGILAIGVLIAFPLSVAGMVNDLLTTADSRNHLISPPVDSEEPSTLRIGLQVVGVDEVSAEARIRMQAQIVCREEPCSWSDDVILLALQPDRFEPHSVPPFQSETVRPDKPMTTVFTLPVRGQPVRYPFDSYTLDLGIAVERTFADGHVETLLPQSADGKVTVTVQDRMARFIMAAPVLQAAQDVGITVTINDQSLTDVALLRFARPQYVQALAVLLIALIAAASIYAVFLRPLHDLLLGAGGIVLGVWGVRNILITPGQNFISVVDFALSAVIMFVLGAISIRAMIYFYGRSKEPIATADTADEADDEGSVPAAPVAAASAAGTATEPAAPPSSTGPPRPA